MTGNIFGLISKNKMAATGVSLSIMKCVDISLVICPRGLVCQANQAGNLLMWSDLTLDPAFKVTRGELNLKVLIIHLLLALEVWDGKPTYRKSWSGNLLLWSDLTLDPTFKVKRG